MFVLVDEVESVILRRGISLCDDRNSSVRINMTKIWKH